MMILPERGDTVEVSTYWGEKTTGRVTDLHIDPEGERTRIEVDTPHGWVFARPDAWRPAVAQ